MYLSWKEGILHYHFYQNCREQMKTTAIQTNTYQLLQRFDKNNIGLWEKALRSLTIIYQEEVEKQKRREEQKARIRSIVGAFKKSDRGDWKEAKEKILTEEYL